MDLPNLPPPPLPHYDKRFMRTRFQHPVEDGAPDGLELLRLLDRCHHCSTVHPLFGFSVVDDALNGLELLETVGQVSSLHHYARPYLGFFSGRWCTRQAGMVGQMSSLHHYTTPCFFQWRMVHQMGWNCWTGVITASLCNTLFFLEVDGVSGRLELLRLLDQCDLSAS